MVLVSSQRSSNVHDSARMGTIVPCNSLAKAGFTVASSYKLMRAIKCVGGDGGMQMCFRKT